MGSFRGNSNPKPFGMSSGGVSNVLWYQASSSVFSLWASLLRTKKSYDERTERTHPNRPKICRSMRTSGTGLLGGNVFHWDAPPPPHTHYFQVLPAAPSRRETPGARAPGQAESGGVIQALVGTRRRRAVSEGFMPPMGQAPQQQL